MSTEDQPETPRPRTRAEARAAREAAERAAAAASTPGPSTGSGTGGGSGTGEGSAPPIPVAPESDVIRLPPVAASTPDPTPSIPDATPSAPDATFSIPEPVEGSFPGPSTGSGTGDGSGTGNRRFLFAILGVVAVLVLVTGVLGAISLFQGPRVSQVEVDAAEAIQVSGSRVILTANQSLSEIDESQVTVSPAVPFTVDATGRNIGIRFTVPLDDSTEYTVTVADVSGNGGGPASDLTTSFTTPASAIFLLNRSEDDDSIFRTDLTGERAVPVFTHPRINDYRATANQLVVAVEDDDGSRILVMDHEGKNIHELELPGDGFVSTVQVSDRGGLVGYTYSDRTITEESGRASVLVTQPISGTGTPRIVEVGGEEASIASWQFVPDTAAVLFIDFASTLSLDDRSGDAGAQNMGTASEILGISRGTYTAIVSRADQSIVELDLADGSETALAASDPDYGPSNRITPFPGGTLRHIVARDASGLPTGQAIIRVDEDGTAQSVLEVESGTAILQACPSPSGQYAAITVAPNLVENPYDNMLVPLPKKLETHLLDLRTGEELVALTGFDASWCQMAPAF
jgi:hypothetical protein